MDNIIIDQAVLDQKAKPELAPPVIIEGSNIQEAIFNLEGERVAAKISLRDEILFRLLERIERAILSK